MGMRDRALHLSALSSDGQMAVFTDKERDPAVIAKGDVWRLRVFRYTPKSETPTLMTIKMPTTALAQLEVSPDGKRGLAVSDMGTRLIGVDFVKGTAEIIFKLEKGQPSFRVTPQVVWFENNRFHTIGYFMDADQMAMGDAVVSVDVPGRGFGAIHKVRDVSELLKTFKGFLQVLWHSSEQVYFVGRGKGEEKLTLVSCFGGKYLPVATFKTCSNLAASNDRVFYGAFVGEKWALTVFDTPANKRWDIDCGGRKLEYTYISNDGRTVLASALDTTNGNLSTFYGHERDGFKMRQVPGMAALPMATHRLSGNGRWVGVYGERGLAMYAIPPDETVPAKGKPKTR